MNTPFISLPATAHGPAAQPIAALGLSLAIYECSGGGSDYLHVHHHDDEAWHVLEGSLTFRFQDGERRVAKGTTVFVPAGVAHTWYEADGPARYLMIMTPRLARLIGEVEKAPRSAHASILQRYDSAIVA